MVMVSSHSLSHTHTHEYVYSGNTQHTTHTPENDRYYRMGVRGGLCVGGDMCAFLTVVAHSLTAQDCV